MSLLQHLKMRDSEIKRLHEEIKQTKVETEVFNYKAVKDDPIDSKLATLINKQPLAIRSRLVFERESQGVYRYHRRRVFMKIEGENVVIRVGGGYMSMEEFVHVYCGSEDLQTKQNLKDFVREQAI